MRIPGDHPLARLFRELVRWRLYRDALLPDREVADYVASILTRFTHVDNLYRIRDARGRGLEEVAEMLIESDPLGDARSFDREREVRKHIGDFTMFFSGLFPESLEARPARRRLRLDPLLDYVETGKKSYAIVSAFNVGEHKKEAPLFRRLSDGFEQCVYGLNRVKHDLERLQHGYYEHLAATLRS